MLYFHKQRLVILCQPKTGTTALHEAISSEASIAFNTPPHMKHMTYAKFVDVLSTWIAGGKKLERNKYTFVSVMREPIDWFGSWYRYNRRQHLASPQARGFGRYTGEIEFNEYLEALLLPPAERPEYARLGGPCSVAVNKEGKIGVDFLFRYSDMDNLVDFISSKLERPIKLQQANVSPKKDLSVDPVTMQKIQERFAFEFDIYDKLRPDGKFSET